MKLALGAYLLKHQLRKCGVEVFNQLGLKILQKINKSVHQVVIAELFGQEKGWQEVLLEEFAGRPIWSAASEVEISGSRIVPEFKKEVSQRSSQNFWG